MAIDISCSNCGKDYRVKDDAAGKSFTCKSCGTKIRIPKSDEDVIDVEYVGEEDSVESPFGNDDDEFIPPKRKKKKSEDAGNQTLGPAIGLYSTAGVALLFCIVLAVNNLTRGAPAPQLAPGLNEAQRNAHLVGHRIGYLIGSVGPIFYLTFILIGTYCLHTRRVYGLAMSTCILATIPCCSPLIVLGIPFGIWGIIVLSKEDVKRSFE